MRHTLYLVAVATLIAPLCGSHHRVPRVVVHHAADLAPGMRMAVDDLVQDLAEITSERVIEGGPQLPPCTPGLLHIAVVDDARASDPQAYTIDEERCTDGHLVIVRGGSLRATQWGIYDFLERLGVRYFHPEETLYPDRPKWPARPLAVRESPSFRRRAMHVHTRHPVELSPPLDADDASVDVSGYQERWIDWNVKLRQTEVDGWDADEVGERAYARGFPRVAHLNLANAQQGGRPVLDADDRRSEREQLASAIDAAMAPARGAPPPAALGFQFNPTEFTTADERATVDRLTFVTDYVRARWPDAALWTINHGTAQAPGPLSGLRFFDLPERAPPGLGVEVHPLMFYDLDRPAAGVYGNADFRHLGDWLVAQQAVRRITYYPEASWWLTFDLPVPLYLAPVTIEARGHDIERLRAYASPDDGAATGVYGHLLFTSGQEWGYWMIDYCTARMAWDASLGWDGCVDHVAAAFAHGDVLGAVLREVAARQVVDLRDPDRLRMLVGSDDETETAARAGIVVHPLPPAPADLLAWSDDQVSGFRTRSLAPLAAMADDYDRWADRVEAVLPAQSAAQAPWVREIRDGLRVFALRARHAARVYDTALAVRAARRGDPTALEAARLDLAEARLLTAAAATVVAAREADYRYVPELQTEGDEPGTPGAVPNRTIYPYRVLSRTHRLFYWRRPDDQLAALLDAPAAAGAAPAAAAGGLIFPRGSLRVVRPVGAAIIDPFLPELAVDPGPPRRGPSDHVLTLDRVGAITVRGAIIEIRRDGGGRRLRLTGQVASDELIERLLGVGGFDRTGARRVVASTLGYTAATLPATIEVELAATAPN